MISCSIFKNGGNTHLTVAKRIRKYYHSSMATWRKMCEAITFGVAPPMPEAWNMQIQLLICVPKRFFVDKILSVVPINETHSFPFQPPTPCACTMGSTNKIPTSTEPFATSKRRKDFTPTSRNEAQLCGVTSAGFITVEFVLRFLKLWPSFSRSICARPCWCWKSWILRWFSMGFLCKKNHCGNECMTIMQARKHSLALEWSYGCSKTNFGHTIAPRISKNRFWHNGPPQR